MGEVNINELMLQVCLSDDADEVQKKAQKWDDEIDIDKLDFTGMRLAPYFYNNLKKFQITSKYEKRLKVLHQFWWLKTNFLQDQLQVTCNELAKYEIQPLIIKGGSLMFYYEQPVLRPMSDIDVLVPFNQVLQTVKILKSLGYSLIPGVLQLLNKYPKMFSDFKHSISFVNKKLNIKLDLHWRASTYLSKEITRDIILEKIKHPFIKNAYIPKLSHEVAIIILHAVLSKSFDNLNWVLDIKTLIHKIDSNIWKETFDLSRKEQKLNLLQTGLKYLNDFNIVINIDEIKNLDNKRTKFFIYDYEVETKENKIQKVGRKIKNTWISIKFIYPNSNNLFKLKNFIRLIYFQIVMRKQSQKIDS